MKNFKQPGDTLTLVAPYTVVSGAGMLIGSLFAVACSDITSGSSGEARTEGVYDLAKTSAQAWKQGDPIYWDDTNKRCDNTGVGQQIGMATADAANPSATGSVLLEGPVQKLSSVVSGSPAPASYSTAGPQTFTAADIVGGVIVRDPNGASRSDVLPTAALLVAAVPGAKIGDIVKCLIVNGADAAEVITIGAGAGGAFDANQTAASRVIGQNTSKLVMIRLTNVTAASEAYVAYA